MHNAVAEQIGQEYAALLSPPKPKKTQKGKVFDQPFVFELPLEIPRCDIKTNFSKWIPKKKLHLSKQIMICCFKFLVHAISCSSKARSTSASKYLLGWGA